MELFSICSVQTLVQLQYINCFCWCLCGMLLISDSNWILWALTKTCLSSREIISKLNFDTSFIKSTSHFANVQPNTWMLCKVVYGVKCVYVLKMLNPILLSLKHVFSKKFKKNIFQLTWQRMAFYATIWYNGSFVFHTVWFFVYFWGCAIYRNISIILGIWKSMKYCVTAYHCDLTMI